MLAIPVAGLLLGPSENVKIVRTVDSHSKSVDT